MKPNRRVRHKITTKGGGLFARMSLEPEDTVYISPGHALYHDIECDDLPTPVGVVKLSEAEAKGLAPCPNCR